MYLIKKYKVPNYVSIDYLKSQVKIPGLDNFICVSNILYLVLKDGHLGLALVWNLCHH